MIVLAFALILLGVLCMGHAWLHNRSQQRSPRRDETGELPSLQQVRDMTCCGQHAVCEKESLLAAVSRQIEYFDDEELDRYQGRSAEQYSDVEADEFREVLYTMRDDEVAAWLRSLQLRAVELPAALRDEVCMIVGERRTSTDTV